MLIKCRSPLQTSQVMIYLLGRLDRNLLAKYNILAMLLNCCCIYILCNALLEIFWPTPFWIAIRIASVSSAIHYVYHTRWWWSRYTIDLGMSLGDFWLVFVAGVASKNLMRLTFGFTPNILYDASSNIMKVILYLRRDIWVAAFSVFGHILFEKFKESTGLWR